MINILRLEYPICALWVQLVGGDRGKGNGGHHSLGVRVRKTRDNDIGPRVNVVG